MKKGLRVGIVGAGVGGLTAAAALLKAGAEPTVLERAPFLRKVQVGGSIHLWPNSLRALRHVGLYDAVRASVDDAAVLAVQTFETARGRHLVTWPLEERLFGLPVLGVVRGEIHEVLAQGATDRIRLGAGVEGFAADPDGVDVRLTGGGTERFDVLVGADGLHSRVRAGIQGESEPYYTGYTAWVANVRMTHPYFHKATRVYFGRGGRFAAWSLTGGRIYWELIHGAPPGGGDGPRGRRQDVLERVAGWDARVREVVEGSPEADIRRADSFARPVSPVWGRGRVTLLGDAAHAMTNAMGQGANQAVEDAVVFARCLARNDDAAAGLREYERLRRPRATAFVRRSAGIARLAIVRNPLAARVRDRFVRFLFPRVYRSMLRELAYDAGAV